MYSYRFRGLKGHCPPCDFTLALDLLIMKFLTVALGFRDPTLALPSGWLVLSINEQERMKLFSSENNLSFPCK